MFGSSSIGNSSGSAAGPLTYDVSLAPRPVPWQFAVTVFPRRPGGM